MSHRISIGLATLALVVAAAPAQDEKPMSIAISYELEVSPGHRSEFESALKEQVSWYQANNETWQWHCWEWVTGDHAGDFVFRSPGHAFADFDKRSERGSRARTHFSDVVGPHIQDMSAMMSADLPAMSHWPEEMQEIPLVSVYSMNLHYGMDEKFRHAMKRVHEAIEESGWPAKYALTMKINGGDGPNYALVMPHKNFADMKGPEKPFWTMIEETMGRQEADTLRATFAECVKEQKSALAMFRPELSYMP